MTPNPLRRLLIAAGVLTLASAKAVPAFAQPKELRVALFGTPFTRGLATMGADFEAATGIKVKIDVVGQDVFETRINLSFTGKTGDIDVVHAPVIQVQRWIKAGWLRPMTANVDAMKTKADILAGPLDAYKVDGQIWAVPFLAETGMLAYRTDLLAKAGFTAPPKTWDDVAKVAAAVKKGGTAGIAMRAAPGQGFNMFVFPMVMRAYGGKFFVKYPTDLKPAMNSPENLKALNMYSTLLNDYGPKGVGNFNFSEVVAAMQSGQVAMIVDGTAVVAQTLDPAKSKFAAEIGIAPVPSGPAGRSPAIAVHGLAIPADAKNPESSFKFIEWATSEAVQTKVALSQPFPDFTRASVAKNPEVIAKYKSIHPQFLDLRVQMLSEANGHYRPLLPRWSEIGAAVGENINSAVNGIMKNQAALKAADEEIAAILARK